MDGRTDGWNAWMYVCRRARVLVYLCMSAHTHHFGGWITVLRICRLSRYIRYGSYGQLEHFRTTKKLDAFPPCL